MTTQPEALQLAELFETYAVDHQPDGWPAIRQEVLNSAAAELRRLHAENEALRASLERCKEFTAEMASCWNDETKEFEALLHQARVTAIQSCIDRLIQGGKPAEAGILRHHFAKDLVEE